MIPSKIVRFLERANVAHAGTRDARLVPHGHRVCGWSVDGEAGTLVVLIARSSCAQLVESLEDNGQFSATIEEYPAHEAYQFKGSYIRHWTAGRAEIEIADRTRERFLKSVLPIFGEQAERPVRAFVQQPAVAVEFQVREIYVQTPGPGAGALLSPEA